MASLSRCTSVRHTLTAADLLSLERFSTASQLDHTPPVLRSWAGLLYGTHTHTHVLALGGISLAQYYTEYVIRNVQVL